MEQLGDMYVCRLSCCCVDLACAEQFCSPFANAAVYLPGFFGVLEGLDDITYDRLKYPAAVGLTSFEALELKTELSRCTAFGWSTS